MKKVMFPIIDEPEVLGLEELKNRERVAGWYARKAGMDFPGFVNADSLMVKKLGIGNVEQTIVIVLVIIGLLALIMLGSSCVSLRPPVPGTTVGYIQENKTFKGRYDVYNSNYMRTGTYLEANPIFKGQMDIKTNGMRTGTWK